MKTPKIAAVLSSYNRGKAILPTINSLLTQALPFSKIIMIDDGSSKDKKVPKLKGKKITQVYLQKNAGVVWGRNLGLSMASDCEYVLLIDDDITLDKDCLKYLVQAFKDKKDAVGVMPVVSFLSKPEKVWSSGSGVNLTTGQTLFFTKKPDEKYEEIPAATSILLVKTEAIKKNGWYDPLYYFCYEDADFYYRLQKDGGKIYCVRDASAYHDIPENLSLDRVAKRSYHIARGRILFLSRYGTNIFLNLVFVTGFALYYTILGIQCGDIMSGLRYILGEFDGLRIYLSGMSKLSKEATFKKNLTEQNFSTSTALRNFKVRS